MNKLISDFQPVVENYLGLGLSLRGRPDVSIYKTKLCEEGNEETSSFLWHHDGKVGNVNVIIYLTDVIDELDGPLQVIPDSFKAVHTSYDYSWRLRANSKKSILHSSAFGKAGDGVIFDTASIHRAGRVKREARYALSFYFDPFEHFVMSDGKVVNALRWKD